MMFLALMNESWVRLVAALTLLGLGATYSSLRMPISATGSLPAWTQAAAPKPPPCNAQAPVGTMFYINGVACLPREAHKCVRAHRPKVRGQFTTVRVTGSCGAFYGGSANPTIFLRPETSDEAVFIMAWRDHEFAFLHDLFAQHRIRPRRIMDLGMNCGLASLYFSMRWPEAEVVSVEPGLDTFQVATLNLVHRRNVHRELGGVTAPGGGYGGLFDRGKGHWAMGVKEVNESAVRRDSFGLLGVPFLMEKYGWDSIDYLKIDIEGSEQELCTSILQGQAQWIQSVKCLTMELHERFVAGVEATCQTALEAAGMRHIMEEGELTVWCR